MEITVVLPVSRPHFLDEIFKSLNKLEKNDETSLFVYVDGDLSLFEKVKRYVRESTFKNKLYVYRKMGHGSVDGILRRRQRIADIHNEIKELLAPCDYVFLTEDDTTMPSNALNVLMQDLNKLGEKKGIATGIQIGRHGFYHIGAWVANDLKMPTSIMSIKYKEVSIQHIHGAGLYGCLTTYENYKNSNFKPYEGILGPDFTFSLDLAQKGLINTINQDIIFKHHTLKEVIEPDTVDSIIQVKFDKINKEWKLSIL